MPIPARRRTETKTREHERPVKIARMKKAKSPARKSSVKAAGAPKTFNGYFSAVPEPARPLLTKMRDVVRSVVPKETTETISYGIPTFKYKGSLVAIAAFKQHCSLFPMGSSALTPFKDELKDYQVTKGTLRFLLDKPLPTALLKKIVKARIAQNELKSQV
jgi:uncharacterized protein YdhG (YjbR/CyaY superfamily)